MPRSTTDSVTKQEYIWEIDATTKRSFIRYEGYNNSTYGLDHAVTVFSQTTQNLGQQMYEASIDINCAENRDKLTLESLTKRYIELGNKDMQGELIKKTALQPTAIDGVKFIPIKFNAGHSQVSDYVIYLGIYKDMLISMGQGNKTGGTIQEVSDKIFKEIKFLK